MSKFDDALVNYKKEMTDTLGMKSVDDALLRKVTKACGPSIYNRDASTIACSDPSELATVRKNFCIKKLGLPDNDKLDEAIKEVCEKFGSKNRKKYRAIFYYLLVVKFGKESLFS